MTTPVTDDMAQFYYSNGRDDVAVDTVEMRHIAFDQPARVVNDHEDFTATLEDDAPANAGETVLFQRCRFDITLPESSSPGLPSCTLAVDNVGEILMDPIDQAAGVASPIFVTVRSYLASNPDEPGVVVDGMSVRTINVNGGRITASVGFEDDLNTTCPRKKYNRTEYQGLVR